MTANVAQVFLTDEDWRATLRGVQRGAAAGRPPRPRDAGPGASGLAWSGTAQQTFTRTDIPGEGVVETWCEVTGAVDDLVSFRWTYVFDRDGAVLTSDSTLRFRTRVAGRAVARGGGVRGPGGP